MARLTTQQIADKFDACVNMIQDCQARYAVSSESAKHFIETTIGAAIFYLPAGKTTCWSGLVSESIFNDSTLSKVVEHEYPRKIAAKELLSIDWSKFDEPATELKRLYYEKYGRFNYVSKTENTKLREFQKEGTFSDPMTAYAGCNIKLVRV
jgi:hypothetical protein